MNVINLILGLSFIIAGAIFILISIPLLKGSIKMNDWYGMRIKKSFESDENWYKINKYGAQQLIKWSALLVLIGIATFFIPFGNNEIWIIVFSFVPVFVIIPPVIKTYQYARKL